MKPGSWVPAWRSAQAGKPWKVRLLREAGGLGDIVCSLPALRWLHETFQASGCTQRGRDALQAMPVRYGPWSSAAIPALGDPCELVLYGFGPYRTMWEMAGVPFTWRSQMHHDAPERRERWVDPDLHYRDDPAEFALSVDLWCPFWLHETGEEPQNPVLSRLEIACLAAGMRPEEMGPPVITPPDEAMDWAAQHLKFMGWTGEPIVLLFPLCAGPARVYPNERWRDVATALWKFGCRVIVMADRLWQVAWWAREAPEFGRVCRLDWPKLAAMVKHASLTLSGDTGPFHLAAACGTRSVATFGMTGGALTAKHYPLARWVQGGPGRVIELDGPSGHCRTPCYHRWRSGFGGDLCKDNGCTALLSIQPEQVIEAALAALHDHKRASRQNASRELQHA